MNWPRHTVSDELLTTSRKLIVQHDAEHAHAARGRAAQLSTERGAAYAGEWIIRTWLSQAGVEFRVGRGLEADITITEGPCAGRRFDVKTKASGRWADHYHVAVPCDQSLNRDGYLFAAYLTQTREMLILGGGSKARLFVADHLVRKGDYLLGCSIRSDRDQYQIRTRDLTPPGELLAHLKPCEP